MYFKKFLKKILLAQISIILTFGVIKTSVANESENFTDYFTPIKDESSLIKYLQIH